MRRTKGRFVRDRAGAGESGWAGVGSGKWAAFNWPLKGQWDLCALSRGLGISKGSWPHGAQYACLRSTMSKAVRVWAGQAEERRAPEGGAGDTG